jgi:hypothetical protein
VKTHLEVKELGLGNYEVKAVQGHVVTRHTFDIDPDFLARIDLADADGTAVVREAFDIVIRHEALAAVPAQTNLEQLVAQYPYLAVELPERLTTGSEPGIRSVPTAHIDPLPAEDRPTHT